MKHFLPALVFSVCTLAAQPKPGSGVIEGHVFNSLSGAPLKKATVRLQASQIVLWTGTDGDGHFQFSGLPAGTYRLSGNRLGFFERPARRPATIAQDGHVTDAEIRLLPEGSISGRVFDEDGDPVMAGRISIFKQVYRGGKKQIVRLNAGTQTDINGGYQFPNLKPGRYLVQAESQPRGNGRYGNVPQSERPKMADAATYYPNAADQPAASPIEVGVGAEVRGIDIHLAMVAAEYSPIFPVRGKVTGVPDPRMAINLTFNSIDRRNSGYAYAKAPDYTFETTLAAGQYTYLANDSSGQAAFGNGSLTVTGDVSGVVVVMNLPPEVPARVVVAGNGADVKVRGVGVDVYSSFDSHSVFQRQTDATGKFEMPKPLRPGRYSIDVRPETIPDGCHLQAVVLGGHEIAPEDFEIIGSAPLEIVLARNAGKITGSAVGEDGKPLLNATVTLYSSGGSSPPRKQAAADDGSFAFPALRPGKYVLLAWEELNDDFWEDPEYRKKYESRAIEITVGSSETESTQVKAIPAADME